MIRRTLSLLLCAALLLSLAGCAYAAAKKQEGELYSLYFEEKNLDSARGGDALRAETVTLTDTKDMEVQQMAETLLGDLLAGPGDNTLKSPIPSGTQLLSCTLQGGHALVDLSSHYGALSGVGLTMADYCITLTLTQLPQISTVSVTVRGQMLAYRDTQDFSPRDVLLSSTEDVVGKVEATLYFKDSAGDLAPEERTLELYEGDTQASVLLSALEGGPRTEGLSSALPDGFSVQSVWQVDDECYVNLPSSALQDVPMGAELQRALNALAFSLCSLDTVSSVQFLVDGEVAGRYGDVPVGQPYQAK